MGKHAILAPSASMRWMLCPGSVALTRDLPESSSEAADEGTLAHSIAAVCITGKTSVSHHPLAGDLEDLNEGNCEALQKYVDYAIGLIQDKGAFGYVETTLKLDHILGPDQFGTADLCVVNRARARVVDLKFGKGVVVHAQYRVNGVLRPNPQLVLYALGLVRKMEWLFDKVEDVVLEIFQPRRNHRSEVLIPMGFLLEEGSRLSKAAMVALGPRAPVIPGELQCEWCPVRATCAERAKWVIDSFQSELALLSPHEIAHHLGKLDSIRQWCNDLETAALDRLVHDPKSIPFWKVVEGVSRRRWRPDAMQILEQHPELFERSLVTLGAAEKLLGKSNTELAAAIEKPRGKPTLAPEDDPRPLLIQTPEF